MSVDRHEIPEYELEDRPVRDGIGEDDNPIPPWFLVTLGGTVVFALFYIPFYLFSGWSSASQWAAAQERAEERYAAVRAAQPTPADNPYRGDAQAIAAGQEVFVATCAACHKPDGSGLVGPSLVDPYWKYGREDPVLFETVAKGRPLGMPPWGAALGEEKIWKVLAYMETLPQSDVPGVGAPDGSAGNGGPGS